MAKIILNPIIERAQGKMGNIVFRRSHTGEMCITKLPDMSKVKWSAAQQAHRQRFKQASAYAKAAMAEPTVRVVYEEIAAQKNKRPFDMAVSDYFKGNDLLTPKRK
jgi:hypothetical protein